MAIQELMYKGKKIVINTEGDRAELTIQGKVIPFIYSTDTKRYVAHQHLGFKTHASLIELAKDVIDYESMFPES